MDGAKAEGKCFRSRGCSWPGPAAVASLLTFCRSLLEGALSDAEIQALCRWQTSASLLIYKRMQAQQAISMLDNALTATITSYTAANLCTISSYHIAQGIHDWSVQRGQDDNNLGNEC